MWYFRIVPESGRIVVEAVVGKERGQASTEDDICVLSRGIFHQLQRYILHLPHRIINSMESDTEVVILY